MNKQAQQLKWLFWGPVIGLSLWGFSSTSQAGISSKPSDHLPIPEYQATYVIKWHGIKGGESIHRLKRRKDGLYHVASQTEPYLNFIPVSYTEKADFAWDSGEIVPHNYFYDIKEGSRHKQGNVEFDWKNNIVSNTVSHEPWQGELEPDMQDKLTHAIKLRLDLMEGNHQPSYTYTVAEDDEIKPYTFTLLKKEMLRTNIGDIPTLKVKLFSKEGRSTHMWMSMKHEYLPVKVNHYKDGKHVGSGEIKSYNPYRRNKT